MTRALAMVSGGLDSILAAKLIKEQGIDVIGVCFKSYFFEESNAKRMCEQIGMPLIVIDFSKEHFEMVKEPKHGWGKNMNPCIDCHAMMMKYVGELLEKYEADFIITGEVLNQRPMSQNKKALDMVKKESGFSDKILRPLCAKNLDPTEMELSGLVDREKLLDISGRTRTRQIELAEKWGIKDYPSPAGGCKLTEPNFSARLKDLIDTEKNILLKDIDMLRLGRHFRISEYVKIIAARDETEAKAMKDLVKEEDLMFFPLSYSGAMVILTGKYSEKDIELAAKISARYSKGRDEKQLEIKYGKSGTNFLNIRIVTPAAEEELNKYMINAG
ncbi:tRNA 4-thiouridine(8) synthase ThiI [Clostridium polyendosporum]|uniref:tRNA 4-thiouridine(8) synthase ThiI n=1 Tax=Clostridium polyendosporum TaxID=69208 RepID=A0A919VEX7_9CLOT|nr:tRNA 4-thiouridine(8) synthase ThiI [Clostridium polyendosporum]GIM29654.1 tRNA 4-thiouridine(8) synthase ThiI [Clostridium polyendosporum]